MCILKLRPNQAGLTEEVISVGLSPDLYSLEAEGVQGQSDCLVEHLSLVCLTH